MSHVIYQVGQSDWARDWPGSKQVGAAYEIRFDLDAAPRGIFSLKVSLLTGYLGTPNLQVAINGYKGIYYVRTQPLYNAASSIGGMLTIELPKQFLAKGTNSLILTPCLARILPPHRLHPAAPCDMTSSAYQTTHEQHTTVTKFALTWSPRSSIGKRMAGWLSWWTPIFGSSEQSRLNIPSLQWAGRVTAPALPPETALGRKDWSLMSPNGKEPQRRI